MVSETFEAVAFPFTIGHEGAFGNDRRDRGNWTSGVIGRGELKGTKYGIASHAYPTLDIKNMTLAEAKAIYKRDYAAKVAYDQMPAGVDVSVWDMGVNAGPGRSLSLLAGALGSTTTKAAALAHAANLAADKVAFIKAFAAKRVSFYRGLSTFNVFGKGWTRRATECEAVSVKTWLIYGEKQSPAATKVTLENEAKIAKGAANKDAAKAGGTAAASVATDQTLDVSNLPTWSLWVIGAAVVLAVAFFTYRFWINRQRAAAYAAVAA
jgi:lysozyme family protein